MRNPSATKFWFASKGGGAPVDATRSLVLDTALVAWVWLTCDGLLGWHSRPWLSAVVVLLANAGPVTVRSWALKRMGAKFSDRTLDVIGRLSALGICWGLLCALHHPATIGALAYGGIAAPVLARLVRGGTKMFFPDDRARFGEGLRWLAVAGVAWWVLRELLTPRFLGGQDARWYAYAMSDAIEQARHGFFPVFVGQGPYQYNGAVHPFMTAPYLHHFVVLCDLLTLRGLSALGVVHLALSLAWMQAALLTYGGLCALEPARRWLAAWVAVVLATTPIGIGYVFGQEMFMTVMALSWLPLVAFGNVRVIRRGDVTAWVCLAAGLALVMMSHAAVGMWATVVTLLMQLARLLVRDRAGRAWVSAVAGGCLLVLLSAWYLWSMVELSPAKVGGSRVTLIAAGVTILGAAAVLRWMATRRAGWWLLALPGPVLLLYLHTLDFNWSVFFLLWAAAVMAFSQWRGFDRTVGWRMGLAWVGLLAAMVVAQSLPFTIPPEMAIRADAALAVVRGLWPGAVRPITNHALELSDLQLGYALWTGLALTGVAGFKFRDTVLRLLFCAATLLVPLIVFVPALSAHVLMVVPEVFYGISTSSFWLRVLPVLAVLAAFGGFLALCRLWEGKHPVSRVVGGVVAAGVLVWNGRELRQFDWRASVGLHSDADTAAIFRPENAQLYSYSYNNHAMPPYLVNGVVDYQFESRLLRVSDLSLLREPVLDAPGNRIDTWTTTRAKGVANWFNAATALTVAPGERLRLKFEFRDRSYEGSMIFSGPGAFWREYYLPLGGFERPSFGVPPGWPKCSASRCFRRCCS